MANYLKKDRSQILIEALEKLQKDTPITAIHPGSIARALTESISVQLADAYDIFDFNSQQMAISTATGTSLDLFGKLYGVERKTVGEYTALEASTGSFMFYMKEPHFEDVEIPANTNIYTDRIGYMGRRYSYSTTDAVTIPRGRTRVYVSIVPNFVDSVFTAGRDTLIFHDFQSPPNTTIFCNNPKAIPSQSGYENDDDFRRRLIKAIRVSAGGTAEAIRFAGLSVVGVRDIKIRQAPYGMGSFEAIVVSEVDSPEDTIVNRATAEMDRVRPLGVRMYVKSPVRRTLSMKVQVLAPLANGVAVEDNIRRRVQSAVFRFVSAHTPGTPIIYSQLMQVIMNSSDLIRDASITSYAINGREMLKKNYRPEEDEQVVLGDIMVSVSKL